MGGGGEEEKEDLKPHQEVQSTQPDRLVAWGEDEDKNLGGLLAPISEVQGDDERSKDRGS